jgi:hypothetical protein
MSGGIYISYRRDDASFLAGRLYEQLSLHFGEKQIFMDIDAIALGEDFVKVIEEAVGKCDVLIAVIGKNWLISNDDQGNRRLDNPEDFVRMEIGAAFKRKIRLIPVLLDGALMPRADELPEDLKPLVRRNALPITDTSFQGDCQRLTGAIRQVLEKAEKERLEAERRPREEKERMKGEPRQRDGLQGKGLPSMAEPPSSMPEECAPPMAPGKKPSLVALIFQTMARIMGNLSTRERRVEEPVEEPVDLSQILPKREAERGALDSLASILASEDFPKEAVHRAVDVGVLATISREPERSPVDCTVFAPDRVERERTGLLQAFLHAPESRRQAEASAKQFDSKATERGHRSLVLDAPIGTTFAFDVEIEGFAFHERTDTLLWTGKPQAATFRFDVPKDCKLGQHAGTVRISQDGAPVGRITFQIEVVLSARKASQRPVGKEARHYHACFCSYSSLDRAEMLKRAQGLRATGLETFIDVLTLRPGDIWNPKIFEAINESDLFVVIWSKNARDSKWVKKESRYALRHYKEHGSPDFVPIPVEGPPIASVPQGLQDYHFNDELLGQIRAAELEMLTRNKEKT